jgi:hypothetical protein
MSKQRWNITAAADDTKDQHILTVNAVDDDVFAHGKTPPSKSISRKVAKAAKKIEKLLFASLRAFASLREIVYFLKPSLACLVTSTTRVGTPALQPAHA